MLFVITAYTRFLVVFYGVQYLNKGVKINSTNFHIVLLETKSSKLQQFCENIRHFEKLLWPFLTPQRAEMINLDETFHNSLTFTSYCKLHVTSYVSVVQFHITWKAAVHIMSCQKFLQHWLPFPSWWCFPWLYLMAVHLSCIYDGSCLTHWGRDKMATIFQTTISNAFSWMKMYEFWLIFHWSLFLRVQLTFFQHWFR